MTDRNDLGGISTPFHPQIGKAGVFIYDGAPGGLGLARQAFYNADELLKRTFDAIDSCKCETGCPACVHSPKCGSGNRPIDKASSKRILEMILNKCPEKSKAASKIDPQQSLKAQDKFLNDLHKKSDKIILQEKKEKSLYIKNNGSAVKSISENIFCYKSNKKENLRFGVLDLETRRSAKEVGGWNKAQKMGVSCVIVYDSKKNKYIEYLQDDIDLLCKDLVKFDLIIGFNIIQFDYKVLSGLSNFNFFSLPTLDLLLKVHERLGYRLSLDRLASQTLGIGKTADGLMALEWWKQGKMNKILKYCRQDVKVTKDLYLYGKKNKFLVFKNKAGKKVRVLVQW